MNIPKVERSRIDPSWCVYSRYYEVLCPWYLVPFLMISAMFASPPKKV